MECASVAPVLLGAGVEASASKAEMCLPIQKRSPTKTVLLGVPKRQDGASDGSSTSAGSRLSPLSEVSDGDMTSPVNWRIRNTFLDSPFLKLTLLQGFQTSRRAWSVPAAGREAREREEVAAQRADEEDEEAEPPAPVVKMNRVSLDEVLPPPAAVAPRPLALAELVDLQPSSKGSVLHFQGTCKPCAFFWKVVGCQYGSECEFCHLCDADERKRRNKEKRMAMHVMQVSSRPQGAAPPRHARSGRMSGQPRALDRVISMP